MESARILRVTPDLYPYSWGGIAVHTFLLSRDQARTGHSVTVLTLKDTNDGLDRNEEFEVVRLPGIRSSFGNPIMPGVLRYVRENLNEFDVVHVHSQLFFSTLLAVWSRRAHEIPVVLTCHGVRSAALPFLLSDLYLGTITRATLHGVQGVLCYSREDARLLAQLTRTRLSQIHIIPNGVPLDLFLPAKSAALKQPTVLWAGRMVRHKGLKILLQAMKTVFDRVPSSRLVMLGTGPELPVVKAEAERLGISGHIEIHGDQPFESMPARYGEAAVCVIPSRTEGMPRTLMEAAASGVPVVATRLPQFLPFAGRGVVLFESDSVSELARSITTILTDSNLALEMSTESRRLATEVFDWRRTVSLTSEFFEQVVSNSSGAC